MIRAARPQEIALLPQIENAADRRYVRAGLTQVLAMAPASRAVLEEARRAHRLWVAVSPTSRVLGFALMKVVDGAAWLDQLSVLERWQGFGLGSALIDRCAAAASERGDRWLHLSTYLDVPWNAPFYRRRGFVPLPRGAWPRGFRRQVTIENSHGHPPWRRVVLRRAV
ncbi:MAG: GNAT family N-acetyltransferase [Reyranellaceae bacterium]